MDLKSLKHGEWDEFVTNAQKMAESAGAHILKANANSFKSEIKSDGSPVTEVDKKTEDIIREIISDKYPDHGILGEERQAENPQAEFVWVIDPIDGTLAFLAGIPVFGTLIALVHGGVPILGIIDMPATGERWIGQLGKPTLKNGEIVKTSECRELSSALMSTSNPDYYNSGSYEVFETIKSSVRQTVYGGSCMAYAQIASGRINIGIDAGFDIHDYLAYLPILQGAGGCITDWNGNTLTHKSGITNILASGNPHLHEQALRYCQKAVVN